MSNPLELRDPRFCSVCGCRLYKDFYFFGRCAKHHTTGNDTKVIVDAAAAKRRGLSYGQYMAAKKEGKA